MSTALRRDDPTLAAACRAQESLEEASNLYTIAQVTRRRAFCAALNAGATFRSLAAEVGLSPAAIQKVVGKAKMT